MSHNGMEDSGGRGKEETEEKQSKAARGNKEKQGQES